MFKQAIFIVIVFVMGFGASIYWLAAANRPDTVNPISAWKGAGLTVKALLANQLGGSDEEAARSLRSTNVVDSASHHQAMADDNEVGSKQPLEGTLSAAQKEEYLIEQETDREIAQLHLKGLLTQKKRNIAPMSVEDMAWLKEIEETERTEMVAEAKASRAPDASLNVESDEE